MSTIPLSRRDAVRLGVIGTAIAIGHRVFVAQGHAQSESLTDRTGPLWTLSVDIQGLPFTSANVGSIAIDDLDNADLDKPAKSCGQVVIRAKSLPEVRKEIRTWFQSAHERKAPLRYVKILLTHRDGGSRRYNLVEVFPLSYSGGDFTTGAESNLAELRVCPTRVEIA